MRTRSQEQSVDIERDVLRALPKHYGRAGGAQRFSRVNRWEGSSRSAFRRANGCPGVAASSQSPPHTAGLAAGHRGVADRLAKFASRVAICRVHRTQRFSERVKMNSPHASCVDKGHRTNRKTNAVQVAGLDRICFCSQVVGNRSAAFGATS